MSIVIRTDGLLKRHLFKVTTLEHDIIQDIICIFNPDAEDQEETEYMSEYNTTMSEYFGSHHNFKVIISGD